MKTLKQILNESSGSGESKEVEAIKSLLSQHAAKPGKIGFYKGAVEGANKFNEGSVANYSLHTKAPGVEKGISDYIRKKGGEVRPGVGGGFTSSDGDQHVFTFNHGTHHSVYSYSQNKKK